MKLIDRVAIVTGAARGIGRAIALRLAKEGANIVIPDINMDRASRVVGEIKTLGRKSVAMKVDVTKSEETRRMAKTSLDEFGRIDILVNNAGVTAPDVIGEHLPFHESTEEAWDAVIAVNLKGVFNCSRAVIEHMMQRRSGKIVSMSARAGMMGWASMVDYSAAKAGVIGFTKALAKEVGRYGINVNCVSPAGPIAVEKPALEDLKEEIVRNIYMGRVGEPEDVANMVAFLVSDEASWITGQNYAVCGGLTLGL